MIGRYLITLVVSLCSASCLLAQTPVNDWENPLFYELNKEAPHASFMLYGDRAAAVKDDFASSPNYHSLNGTWKFNYTAKVEDRIKEF